MLILLDLDDDEESDNYIEQMFNWDEWDAVAIARTESSKTASGE